MFPADDVFQSWRHNWSTLFKYLFPVFLLKTLIKLWSLSETNFTSRQLQTMAFVSGLLGKERGTSPLTSLSQHKLNNRNTGTCQSNDSAWKGVIYFQVHIVRQISSLDLLPTTSLVWPGRCYFAGDPSKTLIYANPIRLDSECSLNPLIGDYWGKGYRIEFLAWFEAWTW